MTPNYQRSDKIVSEFSTVVGSHQFYISRCAYGAGILQCPVGRVEVEAVEMAWEEKSSFLNRFLCPQSNGI